MSVNTATQAQANENNIHRTEDLPDEVNILNRTSSKIEIPSVKKKDGEPIKKLEIQAYDYLKVRKAALPEFRLEDYLQNGSLTIDPIVPMREIHNETARRIGIAAHQNQPLLVIPAFGTQRIPLPLLEQYDYLPWERRNLITVKPVETPLNTRAWVEKFWGGYAMVWAALFFLFWMISMGASDPEIGYSPTVWSYYFGLVGLVSLAGIGFLIYSNLHEGQLGRFFNLLLLSLSAVLPIGLLFYFYGDVSTLVSTQALSVVMLGRAMQIFLIVLFSILPGLMFFQFERQSAANIKERFIQEILQLNPNVMTRADASITYGNLVDEVSGTVGATRQQYSLLGTGIPILLSTWLIVFGWIFLFNPTGTIQISDELQLEAFLGPSSSLLSYAFLGTYFFTLNLVFRRYARGDLTPKAYHHVTVRILSTVIIIWVVSIIPYFNRLPASYLMIFAFLVGVFPESGIAFIQDVARKRVFGKIFPSLQEKHPITDLEGINLYDRVRLLEEGVESVENLVHYNPIELLLRIRIPTPRLIDLVDQAILYLHVRGGSEDADGQQLVLQKLRQYGIRTASNLLQTQDSMVKAAEEGKTIPMDVTHLNMICQVIRSNVWIDYLNHWRTLNRGRDNVFTLKTFMEIQDAPDLN